MLNRWRLLFDSVDYADLVPEVIPAFSLSMSMIASRLEVTLNVFRYADCFDSMNENKGFLPLVRGVPGGYSPQVKPSSSRHRSSANPMLRSLRLALVSLP